MLWARTQQPRARVSSGRQLALSAHPWGQTGLQEITTKFVYCVRPLVLVAPRVKELALCKIRGDRLADPQEGSERADLSRARGTQGGQGVEEGWLDLAGRQAAGNCCA